QASPVRRYLEPPRQGKRAHGLAIVPEDLWQFNSARRRFRLLLAGGISSNPSPPSGKRAGCGGKRRQTLTIGASTHSGPMLLQEGAHFAIEDVGALEVGRVAGGAYALEARARHVLVHLMRQLGPDEA